MKWLIWLIRAGVFFILFAFALNNMHEARVYWLPGHEWRVPMVFVVLAAFSFGCIFGVLAMVPRWWQQWRVARKVAAQKAVVVPSNPHPSGEMTGPLPLMADAVLTHPPRDGL
jgi:lipopolysaccharide assembly protein A